MRCSHRSSVPETDAPTDAGSSIARCVQSLPARDAATFKAAAGPLARQMLEADGAENMNNVRPSSHPAYKCSTAPPYRRSAGSRRPRQCGRIQAPAGWGSRLAPSTSRATRQAIINLQLGSQISHRRDRDGADQHPGGRGNHAAVMREQHGRLDPPEHPLVIAALRHSPLTRASHQRSRQTWAALRVGATNLRPTRGGERTARLKQIDAHQRAKVESRCR